MIRGCLLDCVSKMFMTAQRLVLTLHCVQNENLKEEMAKMKKENAKEIKEVCMQEIIHILFHSQNFTAI